MVVFIDRDGVVNEMCYEPEHGLVDSPMTPEQFVLRPGTGAAIRRLNDAGIAVHVVSNQPGIAKGKMTYAGLDAITEKMKRDLGEAGARLDGVHYCLHHPEAALPELRVECDCRKPLPGLLHQAAAAAGCPVAGALMIGDGIVDVLAGQAAGCRTIWVGRWKPYVQEEMDRRGARPDNRVESLSEAVDLVLSSGLPETDNKKGDD